MKIRRPAEAIARHVAVVLSLVVLTSAAPSRANEVIFRAEFDSPQQGQSLKHTWGDRPGAVVHSTHRPEATAKGGGAAALILPFGDSLEHNLAYFQYTLPEPVPLVPELASVAFDVKANVPVSLKVAIAPYGFIFHGPGVGPSDNWQTVRLEGAYEALKQWCEGGEQSADGGWLAGVIVAVRPKPGQTAEVLVDNLRIEGPDGAVEAVRRERLRRRTRATRVVPVSLVWDEGHRTLEAALEALDRAGLLQADLACLPERCVDQPAEPIPGPASKAIAEKAARYGMYVVGNLLEREGDVRYVTSFLCDRQGRIVGKYRKSHRLPYEQGPAAGFALGDELPVFKTDFGPIGLKIGTDHYFPEIDMVLRRRGAKLIVWSTSPFPVRDEHTTTLALRGRAVNNRAYYAVARYAGREGYGGYDRAFSWTATWPLGRAQVFDPDGHTVADSGHRGGPAVASIPVARLHGGVNPRAGLATEGKFAALAADGLPEPFQPSDGTDRTIVAAAVECDTNLDRLDRKLDFCGKRDCDIACLWEYVWYRGDEQAEEHRERNRRRLTRLAEAAKRNQMYVVIGGELERGFNESVLFDRQGREIGRYTKMNQTTPESSKFFREGRTVGIFDLDFGRICTKICADVYSREIDRVAALHQVDLMLHHTQDAGPFTGHTRLRDHHRCVDDGYFYLRAASQTLQSDHRTYIMDPWGVMLGATQFRTENEPVIVRLQLDNRPTYYTWPEEILRRGPYPDPYKLGKRPEARGDLRAVVLRQRRPSLYRAAPKPAE